MRIIELRTRVALRAAHVADEVVVSSIETESLVDDVVRELALQEHFGSINAMILYSISEARVEMLKIRVHDRKNRNCVCSMFILEDNYSMVVVNNHW